MQHTLWAGLRARRLSRRALLHASARAGVGAAGLALVGCGDDDDEPPAASAAQGSPVRQSQSEAAAAPQQAVAEQTVAQILTLPIGGEPASLDPQRATDAVSLSVLRQLFSPLIALNAANELVPEIAEAVPTVENGGISADGLTYTFRLREGLQWSDGQPLVAQDIVTGAKRLFEPGSGNYYADFYRVLAAQGWNEAAAEALAALDPEDPEAAAEVAALEQSVVDHLETGAPDDRTVVFRLSKRSPVFLLLASLWPLFPVRRDVVDAHGPAWTEAGKLIGNGPFVLSDWRHDQSITLARNPYWHRDPAALDEVRLDFLADRNVEFLAYGEEELDLAVLGPAELVQVRGDANLEAQFRSVAQLATLGFYFNVASPPFDNVRVRQALAGGINREELAQVVMEGAVLPAYGWVPPGMPGHDPEVGLQYRDAVPMSRDLLAQAGYPEGEGLSVALLSNDASGARLIAEWLQRQWQTNLGVEVNLQILDSASYFAARNAGAYQVVGGGWGADYPDPQNWLPLFRTGGMLNAGGYSDATFDALIEEAEGELDNARRLAIYLEAQRRMLATLPFAPLYYPRRNILVKPHVQGLIASSRDGDVPGDHSLAAVAISEAA